MVRNISYPADALAELCKRHGITRLSFFGSVLRDDFDPHKSDVDVLVEFSPLAEQNLTYFKLGGIAADLQDLLGRPVDLSLANSLQDKLRDTILSSAQVQYDAA